MAATHTPSHIVPLSTVFAQLGCELRALAAAVNAIEAAVEHLSNAPHLNAARAVYGLQNLDFVGQSLVSIAAFADGLSAAVPKSWRVDTVEPTKALALAALARRLRHASDRTGEATFTAESDFEMFD